MDKNIKQKENHNESIIRAIDNTGVRMFLYFPQKKTITIPENTCEAYRCSSIYENMPDSFADDFVYLDDYDNFKAMYYEIDKGVTAASAIFHSKDLKFCHHVTLTTVSWTEDGKPESALGIIENITDTMKTAALLQDLEEKLNKKVLDDLENKKSVSQVAAAIGNLYYAIYHISLSDNSFQCFRENKEDVNKLVGERGVYSKGWNDYVTQFIEEEYKDEMYAFGDYKTLAQRLHDVDSISKKYQRKHIGWLRSQFIVAERDKDGKADDIILVVYDINAEMKLDEQRKEAQFEAEHDPLTNLFNRKGFTRITSSKEYTQNKMGFVLIDIDNFKSLNDCYGHDLGDQVLVSVSKNLMKVFRDEDKIFRHGGDEIVILLNNCDKNVWSIICNKLSLVHKKLAKEFSDGIRVTLSVGVCFSDDGYSKEMYMLADEALYTTKQNGRAGCTMIGKNHEILARWSDKAVYFHPAQVLEHTTQEMTATPEESYQLEDKELINSAISNMFFGVMYLDLEHDTFSTVKTAPGDKPYKMGEKKTSEKLKEFITYIVDQEDRQAMRKFFDQNTMQERIGNKPYITCRYRSINIEGRTQVRLIPVKYNAVGKLTHVLLIILILGVSDKGEEDLKNYDKKSLTALYNNVPAGIVMYEWNGKQLKTIHISEYYAKEYGYTLNSEYGENKGGPDFKRVHPDDLEGYQKAIRKALASTNTFQYIYRAWNREEQRYLWVKVDAVAKPQTDGISFIYAVYTDITEQKLAEQHLEKDYKERFNSLLTMEQQTLSICEINLTYNTFKMLRQEDMMKPYIDETRSYETVMMNIVPDIIGKESQKKYREFFSVENLLQQFEKGNTHVEYDVFLKITDSHYEWITAVVDMIQDPISHEVRGVAYSKSSQMKHMSGELLNNTLKQDYVLGAFIVKETDEFYLYNPQNGEFSECMQNFWEQALTTPNIKSSKEELDYMKKNFVKENILKYLEKHKEFRYAFGDINGPYACRREMHVCYADLQKNMLIATIRNITDTSMMEKWKYESEHDHLTGLFNREAAFRKCRELLETHPQEQFVMLHCDIRHFHLYNTFFGDDAGNQLLCKIAGLINDMDKDYDHWAYGRIESDVFCTFFPIEPGHFERHVQYFFKELKNFRKDFRLIPAIGAYWVTDTQMSVEEMFSHATIAAKSRKLNLFGLISRYDEEMDRELKETQLVTNDINRAIAEEEFQVYLQPKYELCSEKIVGAEALARWQHPKRGMISPGIFIPVMEKNGAIAELDRYMWEHVCQILRKWMDEGRHFYPISVNISRVSMYNRETVSFLINLVKKYKIDPKYLELELTETAYMDDPEDLKRMLKELQEFGFKILIDDFGSGYSSLNTLRDLPVDVLKLDMKFLGKTKEDNRGLIILSSVVSMSKLLKLPIVAEGVEEKEQADYLRGIGCEYVQGFLYAKPMPISDYEILSGKELL